MIELYRKTIVCLANSRKPPSGTCVAGREIHAGKFGAWIRPVSARPTRELSLEERGYRYGREPRLLDIITLQLARPAPEGHQQENHEIDHDFRWTCSGAVSWRHLQEAVEHVEGPLWLNGESSSHGENDRVAEHEAARMTRSLYLVRPGGLRMLVAAEGAAPLVQRRVRAEFQIAGHSYRLPVTDPPIERAYRFQAEGAYPVPDALLCVSLGEVFHGYAYKLAAAVIMPGRRR